VIPLIAIFVFNVFLIKNPYLEMISWVVFAIVVQVLVEEIFFRGFIFGALLSYFRVDENAFSLKCAFFILLQAFVFALLHVETKNFLGVFLSGLIFGIVFLLSGKNILPSAILHLALNLSIFIADFAEKLC
jgi:membrane protease YdiL (CAAX protease family)